MYGETSQTDFLGFDPFTATSEEGMEKMLDFNAGTVFNTVEVESLFTGEEIR